MDQKKENQNKQANMRNADTVVDHMYRGLDRDVAIIANAKVRIWHMLLLSMFITGGVSAMFWAADYFSTTHAKYKPTTQTGVVSIRVSDRPDDAEETILNGSVNIDSNDLELGSDDGEAQMVGMRFIGVSIPQGATIITATVGFTAEEDGKSKSANVTIWGEKNTHSSSFVRTARNLSQRQKTLASVRWYNIPKWKKNKNYSTPDLASIVQEIVNQPTWRSGNAIAIFIAGSGERSAKAWDGEKKSAPILNVKYLKNNAPNPPSALIQSPGHEGASTPITTPSFTFTISDSDQGQMIGYQIQIAKDKDFIHLTKNYTWPGNTVNPYTATFKIRPADELSAGSYWWRVRGTDQYGAFSDWTYFGDPVNADFIIAPIPPLTSLSVTKIVSDSDEVGVKSNTAQPGEVLTYTIQVMNTGDAQGMNVTLEDDYDENAVTIQQNDGGIDNGTKIAWDLGMLAPNAIITKTITTRINYPSGNTSMLQNVVSVNADNAMRIYDQTQTTVISQPGTLTVSLVPPPPNPNAVAGATGVWFARLSLDAADSQEDVEISQIRFALGTTMPAYPSLINGLKLFVGSLHDGGTEVAISSDPDPTSIIPGSWATSTFTFVTPLTVRGGTATTLMLKGNVSGSASGGTVSFGINDSMNDPSVIAKGKSTQQNIVPGYHDAEGSPYTLMHSGSMHIGLDPSSPPAGLLPADTNGITVGRLRLDAFNEDVQLEWLSLALHDSDANKGGPDQLDKIWISTDTQTFGAIPTSTDAAPSPVQVLFDLSQNPVNISGTCPPGTCPVYLTIKVDTADVDASNHSKGAMGEGFRFAITSETDVRAKGITSGHGIYGEPISLHEFTLYRSVPTIDASQGVTNRITGNGVYELYKFDVSADPKGPVGIYTYTFDIQNTGVTLSDLELYENTYFSGPVSKVDIIPLPPKPYGYQPRFLFDTDGNGVSQGGEFREIPAGATRTYTLKGTVSGYDAGQTNTVTTKLLGDPAFPDPVVGCAADPSCGGIDYDTNNNFIWTDFNYTMQYNTSSATSTIEWTNGFRVKGLSPSGANPHSI